MYNIKILCPAKINLTLDVLSKRDDGYHNVKMVMQAVSLYDEVFLTKTKLKNISLRCNLPYVPRDARNSAFKAANAFFEFTGVVNEGLFIDVYKNIPVAAGLAGGSTNAAGVIVGLNKLYDTKLSEDKMCEIGLKVGADVPFCIKGGTMLAGGLGEILTPLSPLPSCFIVIAKPPQGVSTPLVYKNIDLVPINERPDFEGMNESLINKDLQGVARRLFNVMEVVSKKLCPEISVVKDLINSFSPMGIIMSGSGTAVFGIFSEEKNALECLQKCSQSYKECHICEPINFGCKIF